MKNTDASPLRSIVTITEKKWNPRKNKISFLKSVNLQEFISTRFPLRPPSYRNTRDESEEEWQTNIGSGELSITEVYPSSAQNILGRLLNNVIEQDHHFSNPFSFSSLISVAQNATNSVLDPIRTKECCIGDCFGFCEHVCTAGELRKCSFCNYETQHLSLLRTHMKIHTNEKKYACDLCDYSTRKSYSLKAHKRTHTGEKPFVCDLCPFACNDGSTLKRHKYTHTGFKPFSCDKCDYKCTRNSHLQRHIRTHLFTHKFECDKCSFSCDLKNVLSTHKQIHSDKKLMTCAACGYFTNDRSSMRRHKLIHSDDKPHACDRCEYKCRRGSHLRRHLKSHERKDMLKILEETDVNPLICNDCGLFANHPYNLTVHECSMDADRLFYCNRCEFNTTSSGEFNTHKANHYKGRLPCGKCEFTCDTHSCLKKHIASHSKKKKYFCRDCIYSTEHFSSMRKHKLNHSENYRHKCDICSYSSKRLLNLKRHKEIHSKNKGDKPSGHCIEHADEKDIESNDNLRSNHCDLVTDERDLVNLTIDSLIGGADLSSFNGIPEIIYDNDSENNKLDNHVTPSLVVTELGSKKKSLVSKKRNNHCVKSEINLKNDAKLFSDICNKAVLDVLDVSLQNNNNIKRQIGKNDVEIGASNAGITAVDM